jgi:hypothetical protein
MYLLYSTYKPNIMAGREHAVELHRQWASLRMLSVTTIFGGGHRRNAKQRNTMQHDGAPTSEGVKSLSVARPLRPCFRVPQVPNPIPC